MSATDPKLNLHPFVIDLSGRVSRLEDATNGINQRQQNADTEIAVVKKDVEYIKDGQDKLSSNVNKVLWGVIAAIFTALVNLVLSNGLLPL